MRYISFEQGLTNQSALIKLQRDGLNKVTPPINIPSWMCCLLPCIKSIRKFACRPLYLARMQQYYKMCPTTARVIRDGRVLVIDAADLVVGDIVRTYKECNNTRLS